MNAIAAILLAFNSSKFSVYEKHTENYPVVWSLNTM